jgi:hypothetical protein
MARVRSLRFPLPVLRMVKECCRLSPRGRMPRVLDPPSGMRLPLWSWTAISGGWPSLVRTREKGFSSPSLLKMFSVAVFGPVAVGA